MATTAADVLIDSLEDWGVEVIFGLPGDGINGIMEALRKRAGPHPLHPGAPRGSRRPSWPAVTPNTPASSASVLRPPGPAAFICSTACTTPSWTASPCWRSPACRITTSLLLAPSRTSSSTRLFADVAAYNARDHGPDSRRERRRPGLPYRDGLSHASPTSPSRSTSRSEGGPQGLETQRSAPYVGRPWLEAPGVPCRRSDLRAAAEILNAGKSRHPGRPGCAGRCDELEEVAEVLAAPIIKALLGKAGVPDDSPYTTGGIGLLGTRPSQEAMENCDTLLMVGTIFPYIEFLPKPGQARAVQIDHRPDANRPALPGRRRPRRRRRAVSASCCCRLLKAQRRTAAFSSGPGRHEGMVETHGGAGTRTDTPMKPQVVARELGKRLTQRRDHQRRLRHDHDLVGPAHVRSQKGRCISVSGTLASMANALPYAIAAQIAHPGRQCVAFVGDGGFSMLMAELATAVIQAADQGHRRQEQHPRHDQVGADGLPAATPSIDCELQPIDFAAFARACGASAYSVKTRDKMRRSSPGIRRPGRC